MRRNLTPLTAGTVLREAERVLLDGSYLVAGERTSEVPLDGNARLAEDEYGVVLVTVYDSWKELVEGWENAQATLVDIISEKMTESDPKAWEGFLVLFCPSILGLDERREADRIRYNTTRVRKIVAAGDDLRVLLDVRRALLPILPFEVEADVPSRPDAFCKLPDLLEGRGIHASLTKNLLEAYDREDSLLESIRASMHEK